MTKQYVFHIVEVTFPDNKVWPTDYSQTVTRYALESQGGSIWFYGKVFGSLPGMVATDRSSNDCRYTFRKTIDEALADAPGGAIIEEGKIISHTYLPAFCRIPMMPEWACNLYSKFQALPEVRRLKKRWQIYLLNQRATKR